MNVEISKNLSSVIIVRLHWDTKHLCKAKVVNKSPFAYTR
uniref:Uncharacterized protein n=1 Tax=Rhizophora mucronata TaxID=61149 RepID=A0A2P2QD58_RHIMU